MEGGGEGGGGATAPLAPMYLPQGLLGNMVAMVDHDILKVLLSHYKFSTVWRFHVIVHIKLGNIPRCVIFKYFMF